MSKNQASSSQNEERGIGDNSDNHLGIAGKRLFALHLLETNTLVNSLGEFQ